MKYKLQEIQNGILMTNADDSVVYYPNIDEVMAVITESLRKDFRESRQFEWDGACTVSLSVSGLPV
jgi:hypothetical protein